MTFPDQLDNRSFRLLVERTVNLLKENQPLLQIEHQLADLIQKFPELDFQSKPIDTHAQFEDADTNPFLMLSAIWEVSKQIQSDSPKGMKKITTDYFQTSLLRNDDLYKVAEIFLTLYTRTQDNETTLSAKEYLWEIYYALNQKDESAERPENAERLEKYSEDTFLSPGTMDQAFAAIARELHHEASYINLTATMPAKEIYEQLPIEWISAMSHYWRRPEQKLKRDHIQGIINFFMSQEFEKELSNALLKEDKRCIRYILNTENCTLHSAVIDEFGREDHDGFWWTQDVPKSTLGLLRMKGLVAVGERIMNGETNRIVMIPKDIKGLLEKSI